MGKHAAASGLVVAAACAALLAGCGGGGGGSGGSDSGSATTKDDALATALGYVPANATSVRFGDSTPWLKEHGFAKESPAALSKDDEFLRQSRDAAFPESDLWSYAQVMKDWGWSATDIAWSATAATPKIVFLRYVRFRDSTDLGVVKKSLLAHGYREHGGTLVGPSPASVKDPTALQIVMSLGHTVRLHPDKHLMVSSTGSTVPALPDDSKSLGNDTAVRTVVAPITMANYVSISTGADACVLPRNTSPAQLKGLKDLGQLTARATAVLSDTKSTATAAYSSSDAASKDLPIRKKFVTGLSTRTQVPYSKLAHFNLTQRDSTIRYTIAAKPRVVTGMLYNQDAPWAMCGPSSKGSGRPSAV